MLYRAHHALAATTPGTDAHADAAGRWQRAFTDIDAHRILQASDAGKGLLHPAAAKVIATLSNEWDGLARHQELPQLPLDNNPAERALRTPVIGRKNFYGSGAEWAAHLAADVWTVTATAARHGIEPLGLLTGHLQACAEHGGSAPAEPAWTRSCPGHPKDAPAAVPPVTSARVAARNLGSPQSRPISLRHMTPRFIPSCPAAPQRDLPRVPRLLTVYSNGPGGMNPDPPGSFTQYIMTSSKTQAQSQIPGEGKSKLASSACKDRFTRNTGRGFPEPSSAS